jgi:hypothetical protein
VSEWTQFDCEILEDGRLALKFSEHGIFRVRQNDESLGIGFALHPKRGVVVYNERCGRERGKIFSQVGEGE